MIKWRENIPGYFLNQRQVQNMTEYSEVRNIQQKINHYRVTAVFSETVQLRLSLTLMRTQENWTGQSQTMYGQMANDIKQNNKGGLMLGSFITRRKNVNTVISVDLGRGTAYGIHCFEECLDRTPNACPAWPPCWVSTQHRCIWCGYRCRVNTSPEWWRYSCDILVASHWLTEIL